LAVDESCPPPAAKCGAGALSRSPPIAELTAPKAASFIAVPDVPLVGPGDALGTILIDNLESIGLPLRDDDVLVIAQKGVSKAEGRYVDLAAVTPSPRAPELAMAVDKDARLVEVLCRESEHQLYERLLFPVPILRLLKRQVERELARACL
jgi:hypothetical protein